jgi:large subunit GTPase 1
MAFLEWRRDIATIEENNVKLAFTPFEKNIEVWKQLWRVIEKSDMLL